jgi:hypothetical protein
MLALDLPMRSKGVTKSDEQNWKWVKIQSGLAAKLKR